MTTVLTASSTAMAPFFCSANGESGTKTLPGSGRRSCGRAMPRGRSLRGPLDPSSMTSHASRISIFSAPMQTTTPRSNASARTEHTVQRGDPNRQSYLKASARTHSGLRSGPNTTGEQCFAVRAKRTAKGGKRKAKALPCVDARQRAHGNVLSSNGFFAVRFSRTARQRPLPCVYFFAVRQISLPCQTSLPCVLPYCRA
jgi:hypothetical protein